MSIVGKNMRRLRREKNIHPQELATKLGCTYQQLNNYETGRTRANENIIMRARRILETTYNELFREGADEKTTENK